MIKWKRLKNNYIKHKMPKKRADTAVQKSFLEEIKTAYKARSARLVAKKTKAEATC